MNELKVLALTPTQVTHLHLPLYLCQEALKEKLGECSRSKSSFLNNPELVGLIKHLCA